MTDLPEDERRQYAAHVILDHARDVERSSICEMAPGVVIDESNDLTPQDVLKIQEDIRTAIIRVSWPGDENVYSDNFGDEDEE